MAILTLMHRHQALTAAPFAKYRHRYLPLQMRTHAHACQFTAVTLPASNQPNAASAGPWRHPPLDTPFCPLLCGAPPGWDGRPRVPGPAPRHGKTVTQFRPDGIHDGRRITVPWPGAPAPAGCHCGSAPDWSSTRLGNQGQPGRADLTVDREPPRQAIRATPGAGISLRLRRFPGCLHITGDVAALTCP